MNREEMQDFISGRLRATLITSHKPEEWVSVSTLCTLYGFSRAAMLNAAWDAHFTDDDNGKLKAKWKLPL
jgi:hypothetical protein